MFILGKIRQSFYNMCIVKCLIPQGNPVIHALRAAKKGIPRGNPVKHALRAVKIRYNKNSQLRMNESLNCDQ